VRLATPAFAGLPGIKEKHDMKRYLIATLTLALTACTGDITGVGNVSPNDPAMFDQSMFDQDALASFTLEDRAYVQGHAVAVYLYGKTLPSYVSPKGYAYEPGGSALTAGVSYRWDAVMIARSGGLDGDGGLVFKGDDEDNNCDTEDPPDGGDTEDPPGGDTEDPPTDDDGDTEDPPDDDCDDPIDEDCEEFLDPAAIDARELSQMVDAIQVLGTDVAGDPDAVAAFHRGMREALYLEDLHEDTDHSEIEFLKDDVQDEGLCEHSPLVLDLDGDGLELAPVAGGVDFDLRGTGTPVRTAWPAAADALLALDRNGNGAIDDGSELFGNSRRHANGFDALAALDSNSDGVIDTRDERFAELALWRDANQNGASEPSELVPAAEAGLVQIDLAYSSLDERDTSMSLLKEQATFVLDTGAGLTSRSVTDVWFRYRRR
jgi:hypothetical protein